MSLSVEKDSLRHVGAIVPTMTHVKPLNQLRFVGIVWGLRVVVIGSIAQR